MRCCTVRSRSGPRTAMNCDGFAIQNPEAVGVQQVQDLKGASRELECCPPLELVHYLE
jgi:hypothetical protein